ncbi:MAG: hypothetical protein KA004_06240 [Verrucomicrobiales bacterium]|nr:hypothetical protein [Verrucomicrobiales bacterium]
MLLAAGWIGIRQWQRGRTDASPELTTPGEKLSRSEVARRLCLAVEKLTSGSQARIVWVENRRATESDPFANSQELRLGGFDSRAGGYRVISRREGNYARPLMVPGGQEVIYTDKGAEDQDHLTSFSPHIHAIHWDGSGDRVLTDGFALDVVLDADGRTVWVYALERLGPSRQQSLGGEGFFRFPLHNPAQREPVWPRGDFALDNVQVSRDGKRFAALFPEREGVLGNPAAGTWHKLTNGCWAGLAPDNSYVGCVFHGGHRQLRFFDLAGGRNWQVDLSKLPGVGGHELFHPRWSNHPRFLTFTGPYPVKKVAAAKGASAGSRGIQEAGHKADVFLVRLSDNLLAVEDSVRITGNTFGDFYPDAWVSGGDQAVLQAFAQAPADLPVAGKSEWPVSRQDAHFVWENADADNQLQDRPSPCRVAAAGIARFGRHHDMILDGGQFAVDAASAASFAEAITAAQCFTVELQLREQLAENETVRATLFSMLDAGGRPVLTLQREADFLRWNWSPDPAIPAVKLELRAPPPTDFQPRHVVLTHDGRTLQWNLDNGTLRAGAPAPSPGKTLARGGRILFGGMTPPTAATASVDCVGLFSRVLPEGEQEAHYRMSVARSLPQAAPKRLRLLARVLSATAPDPARLESYQRMLVDHTWEVVRVISGTCEARQIVVLHWGMLERRPVRGVPWSPGETVELELEAADAHPELASEMQLVDATDPAMPVYFDVSTPLGILPARD